MKRVFILFFLLLLGCRAQAQSLPPTDEPARTRLTVSQDAPLYAAARPDEPEALFLMDAQGAALTEAKYASLSGAGQYLIFEQNGQFGVMSLTGEELLSARYAWLMWAQDDVFFACKSDHLDDTADMLYRVSLAQGESSTGLRIGYGPFAGEELFAAFDPHVRRYGYLSAQGAWGIEPKYEWAGAFEGGRAIAAEQKVLGLIDAEGSWIIPPQYDRLLSAKNADYLVGSTADGLYLLFPQDGRLLRQYAPGSAIVGANGYCALYLAEQTLLIDPQGEEVRAFDAGVTLDLFQSADCLIVIDGEWGESCRWIYSLAGEPLAGPFQEVQHIDTQNGADIFRVSSFEVTQQGVSAAGRPIYAETPGTRSEETLTISAP